MQITNRAQDTKETNEQHSSIGDESQYITYHIHEDALYKRFHTKEEYDDYLKVTGKKIRDLNRERNIMIEGMKKDWK